MRSCKGCNEEKPLSEFNVCLTTAKKQYRKWKCKRCELDAEIIRYASKPLEAKKRDREATRRGHLRHRNGITVDVYDEMLEEQKGLCFICGGPPSNDRRLSVDHDHRCCPDTKKACGRCTRALLCFDCNSALGKFKDDPELLRRAADYIEWFGGVHNGRLQGCSAQG